MTRELSKLMTRSDAAMQRTEPFSRAMAEFADTYANWNAAQTVFLTFDQDWVPEFMLSHILDILKEFDAVATIFATGASDRLSFDAVRAGHEVGLHPNLAPNSTQGGNAGEIIGNLRHLYPDAVGTRFHVLGHSYRDLMLLSHEGFVYDVSTLRLNCPYLLPAWHDDLRMALLTYCWEDGFTVDGTLCDDASSVILDTPGLKIINFHPLNVYLNCAHNDQKAAFQRAIPDLGACTRDEARKFRHSGAGMETVLQDLLNSIREQGIQTLALHDMCRAFRAAALSN